MVFIGHGRDRAWLSVKDFLKTKCKVDVTYFDNAQGHVAIDVVLQSIQKSQFAVMVVTGDDKTADGQLRARQNVVHEIGLCYGRLGTEKVALLIQEGLEEFTNIAGVQTIRFPDGKIETSFLELQQMMEREALLRRRK